MRKHHPDTALLPFACANGSRQDIVFDGAVPIFVNRKIILEFLKSLIVPGADNKLENFLWRVLSCNEMTALLRVNTLWKYVFSEPARWLAGKGSELKEWSIDKASGVLDLIEQAMVKVAADGHTLLDPSFDPFASIAAEQPAFRDWRAKKLLAGDGTESDIHRATLSEARSPAGAGNAQATEKVVALAEKIANAALVAMRDPRRAICSLLTSQEGEFSIGSDASKHTATAGAHVTNCRVESNFGSMDILMRMFRNSTAENMSGIAQQMRNGDFKRPANVDHGRGRKSKHQRAAAESSSSAAEGSSGFFHSGLTPELQQSLVNYTRRAAEEARAEGRRALKAHADEKLARREDRLQTLLNAAIEHYAYALELFDAWKAQRAQSSKQVAVALKGKPEAQQLEYLRLQIEMRMLGCGWTQFATRWSAKADERIGTVKHLTELLGEIIEEEISRKRLTPGSVKGLPTEAAPPHHQARLRAAGHGGRRRDGGRAALHVQRRRAACEGGGGAAAAGGGGHSRRSGDGAAA